MGGYRVVLPAQPAKKNEAAQETDEHENMIDVLKISIFYLQTYVRGTWETYYDAD